MRSTEDCAALDALDLLARMTQQVGAFRASLRGAAAAAGRDQTASGVECHRYESGLLLSFWVEAPLDDGRALTWWMDVAPRADGWVVDGRVSYDGRDPVVGLPERRLPDFRAVRAEAPGMFQALLDAGQRVRARTVALAGVR